MAEKPEAGREMAVGASRLDCKRDPPLVPGRPVFSSLLATAEERKDKIRKTYLLDTRGLGGCR